MLDADAVPREHARRLDTNVIHAEYLCPPFKTTLLDRLRLLPPAGPNDAVRLAEARDDRLQRQLPSLVRGHGRRHLDAAGIFDERAVHFAEMEVGRGGGQLLYDQGPDVGGARRAAIDGDEIVSLFL